MSILSFLGGKPKPRRPLTLEPFAETKLCDGVIARNLGSFAELMEVHARLQAERPEVRVLASLDSLYQAEYTSGHAINAHQLDDIEGHDLSGLGAELFEDGEYIGDLTTPAEFPIRLANLLKRADGVGLDQAAGVLDWEGYENDIVSINRDPEAELRIAKEREVTFQFVPVATAAEALAAFPNGYFSSDLDPMQNLAIARHLEAEYGLGLFGVGASFLGFRREEPLGEGLARRLAAEVGGLYAGAPAEGIDELARVLGGRNWLLLRYTES